MIVAGRIRVDGKVVQTLGTRVDPAKAEVSVDDTPVRVRRKIYIALNKPPGFLCTRRDPEDRRVVSDLLPPEWGHLFTVGRLDRESEGLLFLTNDGDFSLRLTHPRYGIRKCYRVWVEGRVDAGHVGAFLKGVQDGEDLLKADRVRVVSANNSHSEVEIELSQGKNREVRRLFESIDRPVGRLQRVQIGPIPLGQMPVGRWRVLTPQEVKSILRHPSEDRNLNPRLAKPAPRS